MLSVPTSIAVCAARAVAKGLRIYLLNTLASGLLIGALGILSSLVVLVTVFSGAPPPPLLLCRFILWAHNTATTVWSFSVVGYSIMVLTVVRYGKNMRLLYIILSLCFVWGLSLLLTIQYLVPQVYAVEFVAGAVCLPALNDTAILEARISFTVFQLTTTTLVPLVVCVAVPLIVLCYIRRHITADTAYRKAVAKLGLFLVTGNLINSTGVIVTSVLVYLSVRVDEVIYCVYFILACSLYPTPILIIIFLKPVRKKLKAYLLCNCLCNCPSAAKITARNHNKRLKEDVCDRLIIQ